MQFVRLLLLHLGFALIDGLNHVFEFFKLAKVDELGPLAHFPSLRLRQINAHICFKVIKPLVLKVLGLPGLLYSCLKCLKTHLFCDLAGNVESVQNLRRIILNEVLLAALEPAFRSLAAFWNHEIVQFCF